MRTPYSVGHLVGRLLAQLLLGVLVSAGSILVMTVAYLVLAWAL